MLKYSNSISINVALKTSEYSWYWSTLIFNKIKLSTKTYKKKYQKMSIKNNKHLIGNWNDNKFDQIKSTHPI